MFVVALYADILILNRTQTQNIRTRAHIQADPGHIFAPGEAPIERFPVRTIGT